jgi:hypothetical protein
VANAIKWESLWTSRGDILTTELNALASGSRSGVGSAVDNGANLDQWGKLQIEVTFGSSPSAGGYLLLYMVAANDGTNYDSGSSSLTPGAHTIVGTVEVQPTTNAQRLSTRPFRLPPSPVKFLLGNGASVAFPASGSTVELFTANDEVQ